MIDALLKFSGDQAIVNVGDTASTDYADLLAPGNAVARPIYLTVLTKTAVTSAGAATVQFVLQTDDNTGFATPAEIVLSDVIGKATLVAGYRRQFTLPVTGLERYVRVAYRVGTAALTAGAFDAYISDAAPNRIV